MVSRFWNCTEARCTLLERVQGPLEQARHKPLSRIRPLSRTPRYFKGTGTWSQNRFVRRANCHTVTSDCTNARGKAFQVRRQITKRLGQQEAIQWAAAGATSWTTCRRVRGMYLVETSLRPTAGICSGAWDGAIVWGALAMPGREGRKLAQRFHQLQVTCSMDGHARGIPAAIPPIQPCARGKGRREGGRGRGRGRWCRRRLSSSEPN